MSSYKQLHSKTVEGGCLQELQNSLTIHKEKITEINVSFLYIWYGQKHYIQFFYRSATINAVCSLIKLFYLYVKDSQWSLARA